MSGKVIVNSSFGFGPQHYANVESIKYDLEPIFDYLQFDYLNEQNVPSFAKGIFLDRFIPNSLKKEFVEEFLYYYIYTIKNIMMKMRVNI